MIKDSPLTKPRALRRLLQDEPFVIAPGVYDIYSLRAVEQAGFRSAAISGAVLSSTLLGMPDIGLLTLTESVEHCRRLTRVATIPITADADAGYGNPMGVRYTVQLFEEAGASGINIEDQVVPRRWGSDATKEVITTREMVAKIAAACEARRDDDFMIIVRTDAFASEDIESIVRRAKEYEAAGADILLPIGPRSEDDVARLVNAINIPVSINLGTGLLPAPSAGGISLARLRALGVRRGSLPTLLPAAAVRGMTRSLQSMQALLNGEPAEESDKDLAQIIASAAEIRALMGDARYTALEERLLSAASVSAC